MNAVIIAVLVMLVLSLSRVNVVLALIISSVVGGLTGGLDLTQTVKVFSEGLGAGAPIALSYAMLGAFAVAISRSGLTDIAATKIITQVNAKHKTSSVILVKTSLLVAILLAAVSSQNIIPVHIAFIPILIPALLGAISTLQIDRRLIACVLTFGLTATYMLLPVGFGQVFLIDLLLKNLVANNLDIGASDIPFVMAFPVFGMFLGLLVAIFFSYRKPRLYPASEYSLNELVSQPLKPRYIVTAVIAIVGALIAQLYTNSIVIGSTLGLIIFAIGGVFKPSQSQDVFIAGVQMMGTIGFIMISAAGFADVMKATGAIDTLVESVSGTIGNNQLFAALVMLTTGLLITMGIGSSFSTIPIIASIYVPLCISFGFSPLATAALVGTAAALGDAGSPASDSTLGPTSGLNVDGQHDHIWDTVVPTFIHYNIPLIAFGTIAALVL